MPKPDLRKVLGRQGEHMAAQWLSQKGYRHVCSNFTIAGGQIDLVMYSPQGNLVFVEVKTRRIAGTPGCRSAPNSSPAEQRIGPRQLLALRRAAGHFLARNPFPFAAWQLDLIWITLCPVAGGACTAKIRHYQDILSV